MRTRRWSRAAAAMLLVALVPVVSPAVYVVQVYEGALASFHGVSVVLPGEVEPHEGFVFVLAVNSSGVRNRPGIIVETGETTRCIELHGGGLTEIGCGVSGLTMDPALASAEANGSFSSTVCDTETGAIVGNSTISYTASWTASGARVVQARASVNEDLNNPNPYVTVNVSRQAAAVISIESAFFGTPSVEPSEEGLLVEGIDSAALFPLGPGPCGVSPFD